jgi:hypothetical protein
MTDRVAMVAAAGGRGRVIGGRVAREREAALTRFRLGASGRNASIVEVRHEFRPVVDRYAVDREGLVVASPLQHLREKAVCPP